MWTYSYLLVKEKLQYVILLSACFLSINLFSHDCAERERVEKFLRHLMIEEYGLYTLMGSKPITSFRLNPHLDMNERRVIYEAQSCMLKKHVPFEKFRPNQFDSKQLWHDWKKVEKNYLGSRFRIVEDEDWGCGFFINIPSTIEVLALHYKSFSDQVKHDYKPDELVYKIGCSTDPFWKKIKKNHYLMGILFGFGEESSRLFAQERNTGKTLSFRKKTGDKPDPSGKPAETLSINDLGLPRFIVYSEHDEQLEKYKNERKQFFDFFKENNFTELTLDQLKKGIASIN